jgi:hypothetical protein
LNTFFRFTSCNHRGFQTFQKAFSKASAQASYS